jgi:hypothetical protein
MPRQLARGHDLTHPKRQGTFFECAKGFHPWLKSVHALRKSVFERVKAFLASMKSLLTARKLLPGAETACIGVQPRQARLPVPAVTRRKQRGTPKSGR